MHPEFEYDEPPWFSFFVDGPFVHDSDDPFPIPPGWTCEMQGALCCLNPPDCCDLLDTQGEWDFYGTFLMVTNTGIPIEQILYPFAMGWYPHADQGTEWWFDSPPGSSVVPEQSYCGLYFEPLTAIEGNESLLEEFWLAQNHPNPFNASTIIRYALPEEGFVSIEIYNILGRKIETLVSGIQPAGSHSVVWDAEDHPSGAYFYRIKAGEYIESRSCLILK